MQVLGTHKVSWDSVRRLAIECHALDAAAFPLLNDSVLNDKAGKIKTIYEELLTERLLALAIALRTRFYQGVDPESTKRYSNDCGLLYTAEFAFEDGPHEFSFKDICDKIVHADCVVKSVQTDRDAEITTFIGRQKRNGKFVGWRLALSVTLFSECLLNWIEGIE